MFKNLAFPFQKYRHLDRMRLEELPKFLAAKLTDQRRKQTAELSQSTALPFWGVNKIKELREPHESNPGLPQEKAKCPLLTKAFLTIHEMGCEGRGEGKPWLSLTPAYALMHFRVPRGFH